MPITAISVSLITALFTLPRGRRSQVCPAEQPTSVARAEYGQLTVVLGRGQQDGLGLYRAVLEQIGSLQIPTGHLVEALPEQKKQQRVSAEVEEIDVQRHGVDVEHLSPRLPHLVDEIRLRYRCRAR